MPPAQPRPLPELMATLSLCDQQSGSDHAGGFYQSGLLTLAPGLLRQFGADPEQTARKAGLDPSLPGLPGSHMSYTTLGRYLEQCVADSGCAEFGLLLGADGELDRLGPVARLMRQAPTLGAALQDLALHQIRFARGGTVYLHRAGGEVRWGFVVHQPEVPGREQIAAGAIAFGARILHELAPDCPCELYLAQSPPADRRQVQRLEKAVAARIHFNADFGGVALPAEALNQRLAGADRAERARLAGEIRSYWASAPPNICYRVFRTLMVQFATGRISLADTAALLALHPRTLERRLEEEGTSFLTIREAARYEIARQLLQGTRLSITNISLAVGYSQPAVFSRTFRKWAGVSPRQYRSGAPALNVVKNQEMHAARG